MTIWSNGDVGGGQTLIDNDHLYPAHINELRVAINSLENLDTWGNVFNVIDYGALGDGSTDDTVAIQAAIDACCAVGGVVLFPHTNSFYKITDTLNVDTTIDESIGIGIMGVAGERTAIKMTGVVNKHMMVCNTTSDFVMNHLFIANLAFNSDGTNYDGLKIDKWIGPIVYNCRAVLNGLHGMEVDATYAIKIDNCQCDHNVGNGITMKNAAGNNATVSNCRLNSNGTDGYSAGLYSTAAQNLNVTGNDLEGNWVAFDIVGMLGANFDYNYVENTTVPTATDIIRFDGASSAVSFRNNYFQDKQFSFHGQVDLIIENNYFANCNLVNSGTNTNVKIAMNTFAGTSTDPHASSLETFLSTTKGFLLPTMTGTQRDAISAPAEGLVIYNTSTHKLNVRTASAWEQITSS